MASSKRTVSEETLNREHALSALNNSTVREKIKIEEDELRERGVSAVPTMFFNNERKFIGAQPVGTYKELLAELSGL